MRVAKAIVKTLPVMVGWCRFFYPGLRLSAGKKPSLSDGEKLGGHRLPIIKYIDSFVSLFLHVFVCICICIYTCAWFCILPVFVFSLIFVCVFIHLLIHISWCICSFVYTGLAVFALALGDVLKWLEGGAYELLCTGGDHLNFDCCSTTLPPQFILMAHNIKWLSRDSLIHFWRTE